MKTNIIYNENCLEGMKKLSNESIDAVITDPPYGLGIDEWDIPIDIDLFAKEIKRVLKKEGFLAFFGQMPTLINWINSIGKSFQFKEHITWVKRTINPSKRLSRGHEEIMIYSKGNSTFYQTKGRYEDVKVPGLMFDIISIEGIKRHISDLQFTIKTGQSRKRSPSTIKNLWNTGFFTNKYREVAPEFTNFTNVWSFTPENQKTYNKGGKEHPTIKPFSLIERLVEMLSKEGDIILDPFIGSGTTAVACVHLKRHYIGFETSKKYCRIAKTRLEAEKTLWDIKSE